MAYIRPPVIGVIVCILFGSVLFAQTASEPEKTADKTQAAVGSGSAPKAAAKDPVQSGIDRPAILVAADSAEVTTKILLRGLDAEPAPGDLEAGLLSSNTQPTFLVRPTVTLHGKPAAGKTGEYLTTLKIDGLAAFGESSAPLLYKGKQVEVLRFSKPGLIAKPPVGDAFVVRDRFVTHKDKSQPPEILFVLENPSTFEYRSVRARLRFDNQDVCLFAAEHFSDQPQEQEPAQSCDTNSSWTKFAIPQYAQVSLRADPSTSWFFDPNTGFARSAKRKGWLTLRYQGADSQQIQEQNLPIEFQFEPNDFSLFRSLLIVTVPLIVGASLSLFLRVTVPNMKRKNQLKDQLSDAGKVISTISTEVDSNLRVLLRVDRRLLDELRMAVWPFGPGYADYAKRVEQGIPTLNRRIDAVLRLDAALIRKKTLTEQSAAPTRLEQIEEMLSVASETLKQDQVSEEDWVFVNQRLENAQKLLREPTQTEKEAFEAMLSGRWKSIREHFADASGIVKVPETLKGMEDCFPASSLLPRADDKDGSQWLNSVGVVRADLQLSALALVWEFEFLAPTAEPLHAQWVEARTELNRLLSTPAIDNLRKAKRLLRQLAEGVSERDVIKALQSGGATLAMDPSVARPDRTIRFSVRFRQANLNTAAARQLVSCRWVFTDSYVPQIPWIKRLMAKVRQWVSREGASSSTVEDILLPEDGWYVHHYFEKDVFTSAVSVNFHNSHGEAIALTPGEYWPVLPVKPRPSRRGKENWQRFILEVTQVGAALLIPLATLASTTISGGTGAHWWELVAIGFGSDTIKNILVGKDETQSASQGAVK
jgi:hypothetical protein